MEEMDLEAALVPDDRASEVTMVSQAPVIAAVDFTRESEAALIWASRHAESIGAPLEILHAIHDPADKPGRYKSNNGDTLEPITDVAERKMAEFTDRVRQDNPTLSALDSARSISRPGLPASTIVEIAQAHGAQLIVVGSQRRHAFSRFLHGSTAHRVAVESRVPVTIVKADV